MFNCAIPSLENYFIVCLFIPIDIPNCVIIYNSTCACFISIFEIHYTRPSMLQSYICSSIIVLFNQPINIRVILSASTRCNHIISKGWLSHQAAELYHTHLMYGPLTEFYEDPPFVEATMSYCWY